MVRKADVNSRIANGEVRQPATATLHATPASINGDARNDRIASLLGKIPAANPEELERKLQLLSTAGTLKDLERKLTWDTSWWALVRQIPAATPPELERKLQLLARGGSLADVERKLDLSSDELELVDRLRAIQAHRDDLKRTLEALAIDPGLAPLIRSIPDDARGDSRHKLEILAKAGTLPQLERKIALDPEILLLLDGIPAASTEELKRKLELLCEGGSLADVERKLSWPSNPWLMVRQIPADTPDELERKLELLANAGSVAEVEKRLSLDGHTVDVVKKFLADSPGELQRKFELVAQSGSVADTERKLRLTDFDLEAIKLLRDGPSFKLPELKRKLNLFAKAGSIDEIERKLNIFAKAGSIDEIERKLGILSPYDENLLKLIRRIPAESAEELEAKIASLIPEATRVAAISEERERSKSEDFLLVGLAKRIPANGPVELEGKINSLAEAKQPEAPPPQEKPRPKTPVHLLVEAFRKLLSSSYRASESISKRAPEPAEAGPMEAKPEDRIVWPKTYIRSTAEFSSFEENLIDLLRRVPAMSADERAEKVASLINPKARDEAKARSREFSTDPDSYLINLSRHISSANPQELDQKINSLITVAPRPAGGRGAVCIVARKPIANVTRGPRMAKALTDAGYRVTVIATRGPVDNLRFMCPEVEYLVASNRSFIHELFDRLEEGRKERDSRREENERIREEHYRSAIAKGGIAAFRARGRKTIVAGSRKATDWTWNIFVAAPCAILLKTRSRRFPEMWRDLSVGDGYGLARKFLQLLNQWASTHTFADNVDQQLTGWHFDVVQAYDNYALVAAARLASRTGARLVYDAVEIAAHRLGEQDLSRFSRICERLQRREEARIFRKADAMIGTGDALAGWYAKNYQITKPLAVRNCRYYWPYQPDGRLRADIRVDADTRLLLWCGHAYPEQGIEVAIRMLPHLSRDIHLVVVTDVQESKQYITEELPAVAGSLGVTDRVHIVAAREPNDLVPYISDADIGFVLSVPVDHPNQYYNLPNKFFECIMARLPIGTLRFPEVAGIVEQYKIGAVLDEHDAVNNAAAVQAMLEPENYAALKAGVMKAAESLSWENESRPYVKLVDSLMPLPVRQYAIALRNNMNVPNLPAPEAKLLPRRAARTRAGQLGEENQAVNAFLALAHYCHSLAEELKADAYVTHGVEALPAAEIVAKTVGGRVYCDVVETPSFKQRSVAYDDWHPTNLALLDHAFDSYLRRADGISTIGWALGEQLRSYGPPVTVIPNYRYAEELRPSTEIRERCHLRPDDILLLASSTICTGFEPVIESLLLLPENVHLATLGRIVDREKIRAYPAVFGLQRRVHFLDQVPYELLTTLASGANLGLMALNPDLTNDRLSLPNRLFDTIAAGLPVVTPDVPDISKIVNEWKIGITAARNEAGFWAEAIRTALAQEQEMRPRVLQASKQLVWELVEDDLYRAYGQPESVTMIGYPKLADHQRTLRKAKSLARRGVRVTICCPHYGSDEPEDMPGIRFVFTPHPHSGQKIVPVPAKQNPVVNSTLQRRA